MDFWPFGQLSLLDFFGGWSIFGGLGADTGRKDLRFAKWQVFLGQKNG